MHTAIWQEQGFASSVATCDQQIRVSKDLCKDQRAATGTYAVKYEQQEAQAQREAPGPVIGHNSVDRRLNGP